MPEGFVKPKLATRRGSKTTDKDTYEVVEEESTGNEYWRVRGYIKKLITLICTTKDLVYSLEGALVDADGNPANWIPISTDQSIAVGSVPVTNSDPWDFLRIFVKPAAAGQNGTLEVEIACSSL